MTNTLREKIEIKKRELKAYVLLALLEIHPEWVTHFSNPNHRLPRGHEKIEKTNNVLDDLVIIDDDGFSTTCVNLIMRGKSFDFNISNITKDVYLLNWTFPKDKSNKITQNPEDYRNKRHLLNYDFPVTYVGSNFRDTRIYMENGAPIIFIHRLLNIDGEIYNPNDQEMIEKIKKYTAQRNDSYFISVYLKSTCKTIRPGSGITAVLTLAQLSKKINVYGWDFYMESSIENLSHFRALRKLFDIRWDLKTGRHLEMSVIHWLYASRLLELDHVAIQGNLTSVSHHKSIIKKISRIFYK